MEMRSFNREGYVTFKIAQLSLKLDQFEMF